MHATEYRNPLRKWVRSAWIAAVLPGAAVVLGEAAQLSGLVPIGGGLFLLSLVLLPLFYLLEARYRRNVGELLGGGYWFRWVYSPEEVQRSVALEWARTRRKLLRFGALFFAAGLAGGLLPAWLGGHPLSGLSVGLVGAVGWGIVLPGGALAVARLLMRRRLSGPAEAFVGPRGVYIYGRYLSWGSLVRGARMSIMDGLPVVRIEMHGKSSLDGRPEIRVPVPLGREEEGAEVAKRIRAMTS